EIAPIIRPAMERFPWAATAAVGVAGVALGLVGGYFWGANRAHRDTPTVAAVTVPQTVAPAPSPVAEPPAATAPVEQSAPDKAPAPVVARARERQEAPAARG